MKGPNIYLIILLNLTLISNRISLMLASFMYLFLNYTIRTHFILNCSHDFLLYFWVILAECHFEPMSLKIPQSEY